MKDDMVSKHSKQDIYLALVLMEELSKLYAPRATAHAQAALDALPDDRYPDGAEEIAKTVGEALDATLKLLLMNGAKEDDTCSIYAYPASVANLYGKDELLKKFIEQELEAMPNATLDDVGIYWLQAFSERYGDFLRKELTE